MTCDPCRDKTTQCSWSDQIPYLLFDLKKRIHSNDTAATSIGSGDLSDESLELLERATRNTRHDMKSRSRLWRANTLREIEMSMKKIRETSLM